MLENISKWKDKIVQYVDVRVQLVKLEIIDRSSKLLSYFIFLIVCLFLMLSVLIFLGLGLAEYFSELTKSSTCGYFITTGIYVVLLIILLVSRKRTLKSFADHVVRIITENDEDHNNANETKTPEN